MKAQWHPTLICWAEIFHCYRLGVCKLDVTSDLTVEPYTLISMPWTKTVVAHWQFADSTSTGKECLLFRVQSGWCNPSMGNSCLRCWWASWTKLTYERKWNRVLETMKKCPLQLQSVLLMLYFLIFDILRGFFPHFSYSWRTLWSLSSPFWPTCQPIGIQPTHSVIHILQHAVGMLVCNEIHTQKGAIVPSTTHYTGPDKPGGIFVTWHTWHSLCSPGWRHKGKSRSVLTTILIIY